MEPLPDARDRAALHAALHGWFVKEGRDYPWRQTTDPYAILVSEVMLQQTQIATVLGRGYYSRWMACFPDLATLAAAPEEAVLRAWEGLGYYSRARNLQKAARAIIAEHGGVFPAQWSAIAALPGIGRYTAGAVASFSWDQPTAIVDGNVSRVMARWFACDEEVNTPAGQKRIWAWAETLLDRLHPRLWNSALMELGQQICTSRNPLCLHCPARPWCQSAGPDAHLRPLKKRARTTVHLEEHALWCVRRNRVLLCQETGPRRRGLWRLPLREPDKIHGLPLLHAAICAITHHRVSLRVYAAPLASAAPGETWHPLSSLPVLPMPGPLRRAVDACLATGQP